MTSQDGTSIHRHRFDNGLTLAFEPMPWLRSASLAILLPVGAIGDPEGREGSATVIYDWLFRGAGERDSREFSDALDALGVRRGGSAGRETTTVSASMLARSLPDALPLLADLLRNPRLADDEFGSARDLALEELASLDDNPTQRLFEALTRAYFSSPHGRSPYGTEQGLHALTPDEARSDHGRRFGPRGAVLAVAGGLEWEELLRLVDGLLGDWEGREPELPGAEIHPPRREHVEADSAQVQIGLAYGALPAEHPDWYRQALATQVLSGGSGSRLFSEVREKRGLVYSVGASVRTVRGSGYTMGYAGTTPERAEETLSVMLDEIGRLRQGVQEDELERARTGILSQLVMQGESSGARASALAHDIFLRGEPRSLAEVQEAIRSVSLTDVNAFLAEQPAPEPTILTLGPARPVTA